MGKFYAVKKGRKTGIYTSWTDAETQVKGYPGALYKSFTSKSDAEDFIDLNQNVKNNTSEYIKAYVDGSFDKNKKVYGSGIVIIKNNIVLEEFAKQGNHESFTDSYQIAGEIIAALEAISWARKNNYNAIEIFYDYEGIEKWALGLWKANKPVSKYYIDTFQELSKGIHVIFNKVKAHSGNRFNELADALAKQATKKRIHKHDINEDMQGYPFESIQSHKKNLYMNLAHNGSVFTSNDINILIKKKWKKTGRLIKDIKDIKIIADFSENKLIAEVKDHNDNLKYITIYGDELNG